jgi:hypothetical protein
VARHGAQVACRAGAGHGGGLVIDEPDAGDEIWWVTVDYMAVSPPWDLGIYDT